jgi:uncharacterized protein (TIGR02452 family)
MAYDKSQYWTNKKARAEVAKKHTQEMRERFAKEIEYSVSTSTVYSDDIHTYAIEFDAKNIEVELLNTDSVTAIFKNNNAHVAVLNFASYKKAGGMFIEGSKAQEECLCHASTLYNVLKSIPTYYAWNEMHKNKALYENRAIYSKDIVFFENSEDNNSPLSTFCFCDVITCAAPNLSAAQKYCNVSEEENREALKSRIHFIFNIAAREGVENLILGAYGCGVFGQNPEEVAEIFAKEIKIAETEKSNLKKIIFAIPGADDNYNAFKKVFG